MAASPSSHEQHRVLTIRGTGYCDSDCIFCIEKHGQVHPSSPVVARIREMIVGGAGRYNMLFFANGEPSVNPKLFEYVTLGRAQGYEYFGMSSHFRAFADPHLAKRVLEAGFEFFDISLHAASYEGQIAVNPIGDGGRSLKEAVHGLRNLVEVARRLGRRIAISHKVVISRLNYRDLPAIFDLTYRHGVRHYVFQPVRAGDLPLAVAEKLTIAEDELLPDLNELLRRTEESGARIKLFGMSQVGVYPSRALEQETNIVKNVYGKQDRAKLQMFEPRPEPTSVLSAPPVAPTSAREHRITLRQRNKPPLTFTCHEDEFLLNAALASGAVVSFGCRMGSCTMCCSKLLEGSVEHDNQLALTEEQLGRGYVLLCRSQPRSDVVIEPDREGDLDA
jgi:ferredoxin